jgi:hypothetical protein
MFKLLDGFAGYGGFYNGVFKQAGSIFCRLHFSLIMVALYGLLFKLPRYTPLLLLNACPYLYTYYYI